MAVNQPNLKSAIGHNYENVNTNRKYFYNWEIALVLVVLNKQRGLIWEMLLGVESNAKYGGKKSRCKSPFLNMWSWEYQGSKRVDS